MLDQNASLVKNSRAGLVGWLASTTSALTDAPALFVLRVFRLSVDGLRVTQTETLEHRTPLVDFATTGAIAGENFYFIANIGIGNLKDDKIIDPKKLEPIHIAVVALN